MEDILDRLIDYGGVLGSHRSQKSAGSSNILANNSLEILGLPKGILLKSEFETPIK